MLVLLEEEIQLLDQVGFPQERCINYLTPETHEEIRVAWQNRKWINNIKKRNIKLCVSQRVSILTSYPRICFNMIELFWYTNLILWNQLKNIEIIYL